MHDPVAAMGCYLHHLATEAEVRGYRFDRSRIAKVDLSVTLSVSSGQLGFEWGHLLEKLRQRAPEMWQLQRDLAYRAHPMFEPVDGDVEPWERAAA